MSWIGYLCRLVEGISHTGQETHRRRQGSLAQPLKGYLGGNQVLIWVFVRSPYRGTPGHAVQQFLDDWTPAAGTPAADKETPG
jgi:hypothetical protein